MLYAARTVRFTPDLYISYDYGEVLTLAPSYNLTYNETMFENNFRASTAAVLHKINLQTTIYWPQNWIFGNDFGYTYNSNISTEFKKDFYLWNTSLSYRFFDKKMMFKVKVYDILNQNQSVSRSITATAVRDEENTVLKRYAMFSFTYKMGNFNGKKKREKDGNRDKEMSE